LIKITVDQADITSWAFCTVVACAGTVFHIKVSYHSILETNLPNESREVVLPNEVAIGHLVNEHFR
jgi:hypothetical protein